jgi:hypothetical protein
MKSPDDHTRRQPLPLPPLQTGVAETAQAVATATNGTGEASPWGKPRDQDLTGASAYRELPRMARSGLLAPDANRSHDSRSASAHQRIPTALAA